jgi:(4-O-methyl)-D-glucuronate---lignin esterase
VGHIYGQNIVGAESMTSRGPAWSFSPGNLKKVADLEFALGVNRFEIHESTHQPVADMAPGLTLGPYGLWFNRNDTWAKDAQPWITYLARCSWLLQQGHFSADVAYFYGEEGPLTAIFGWKAMTDAPDGYAFDFVNSDVVLHELSFKDGRLVTPGGTSYRILYLGGRSQRMTLPVLRRLKDLVTQGAVVVGERPTDSPSLADDPAEWKKVADSMWGKTPAPHGVRRIGKGRLYIGITADDALEALDLVRDFDYMSPDCEPTETNERHGVKYAEVNCVKTDANLMYVHRKLADGDVYFVDNRNDRAENLDAIFRVDGKAPELWDAASGETKPAAYSAVVDGRTNVRLHLEPYGTTFVVFREPTKTASRILPEEKETELAGVDEALSKDWTVNFEPNRGAPETAQFDRLISWSESADMGVKYFSGSATYTKTIDVPASAFSSGAHQWLDLGDVENLAEVIVNGKDLGILWKTPFRIDVSDALKPGSNEIKIEVTNLWVNRMVGDQQSWALKKYAFADFAPYKADSPLLPSGLLGPVQLISVSAQ